MRYLLPLLALTLTSCSHPIKPLAAQPPLSTFQTKLVQGARDQLTWGTGYDNAYYKISYPYGDLPRNKGVCTDVIIRAYRYAGIDLQQLIHEDMLKRWSAYPRYKSLSLPDSSIDHRRVPNQKVFFKTYGKTLSTQTDDPNQWQPGDIVDWKIVGGTDHTGILTDKRDADGFPYVIHNIGNGPHEEDVIRTGTWRITGHYRYLPKN